ncbi:MAG: RodZ domain-containing protein [Oceanisphaera sp.]|uniref:RodZ domain-containing protein n=1 Tax=Oceanisphaera sp. TaxID=1929979 RepID=UPI003F978122
MTINETDTQPQADTLETAGPGPLLRNAREAKGWTQAEVARRLNLRLAVIESIDSDQHKAGVALTFLRGYVKAYAKVVGVDERDVLAAFDAVNAQEPAIEVSMKSFSKKTRQQASDKWLKRISWLVFLGLLASLVYWWWQEGGAEQMGRSLPATSEQNTSTEDVASPGPSLDATESANTPLSSVEPSSNIQTSSRAEVTERIASEAMNADSKTHNIEDNLESANVSDAASQAALQPDANPKLLSLRFTDDCWIKITDSTGVTLSEGTKKAQQSLTLEGTPPFKVVLGLPHAVHIEYMDQAVDLSSFSASRAARLTIP